MSPALTPSSTIIAIRNGRSVSIRTSTIMNTGVTTASFLNSFINFESNDFILNEEKTNNKKVYIETIDYNIRFPKIYSTYSINKVFNSAIINENINFILYNMVANKILKNVLYDIYDIKLDFEDIKDSLEESLSNINELIGILNRPLEDE